MSDFKKLLKNIGGSYTKGKVGFKGNNVKLSSFFKLKKNGRFIPKNESEIKKVLEKLDFGFARSGSIYSKIRGNVRFTSMEKFRKALKSVPLYKRTSREVIRPEREIRNYPYFERRGSGIRKYFINNFDTHLSEVNIIMEKLVDVVNSALRSGITVGGDINIRFTYDYIDRKTNEILTASKSFNSFKVDDLDYFETTLIKYIEILAAPSEDYLYTIKDIIIKMVKENSGGCNPNGADNTYTIGDCKIINPKDTERNNCLFNCLRRLNIVNFEGKTNNKIRREFGINKNEKVPISTAIKIFLKYKNEMQNLTIHDNETKEIYYSSKSSSVDTVFSTIRLKEGHYAIVQNIELKKCADCLKTYRKTHNCNESRVSYQNSFINKNGRSLIGNLKKESKNNENEIMHYDLETYRKMIINEDYVNTENKENKENKETTEIHTPYIIGYNIGNEFSYKAGDNCIELFVDLLIEKAKNGKFFLNAYNGSRFDHYMIYKEFIKRNLDVEKLIINNGAIISFKYKGMQLIDLCNHLMGGLKNNLESFKCKITKGDFDHEKASKWEDMNRFLKMSCIKYLKADVMGLKELYEKVNNEVYNKYGVNISNYISTSSLTYKIWKSKNKEYIKLPTLDEEKDFRKAIRGGRTYKNKHRFISNQYKGYKDGTLNYEDIDDYIVDSDVVSLYPTAMANYEYPVGMCYKLTNEEILENKEGFLENKNFKGMKGKMGIYNIKYITNKNLQHAIGGRRTEESGLKWDLVDNTGWYSSIDIEDMIENGYKVEILDGYYWTKTAFIFKDYIEDLFKKKQSSEKGTAAYELAKLFMNSLYGKMIQRPIFTITKIITTSDEYWKFWGDHIITNIEDVGDKYVVSGTPKDSNKEEKCITKPTHLGVFILAYSRRIMVNYMKESNPYFNSTDIEKRIGNDFYYTDTDSLHIHSKNANLKRLGDKELGGIDNDLGEGSKVIRGLWIAPKLYMLEYIKKGDKENKIHYHFRGKGLNKVNLTVEAFEKMDEGGNLTSIRDFQMKKIHIKRNSKQQHIDQFSIVHYRKEKEEDLSRLTRVVNNDLWDGRLFINNNDSVPFQ